MNFFSFLSLFILMSCSIRHYIFENLLIITDKVAIKPVSRRFLTICCNVYSITNELTFIKLSFIFTSIIKKQISLPMPFKIFDISIIDLTFRISNGSFSNYLPFIPLSFDSLTFWET